jgi:hypothetical protein
MPSHKPVSSPNSLASPPNSISESPPLVSLYVQTDFRNGTGTVFSIENDGNPANVRQLSRHDWSKHQAIGKLLAEFCGVRNAGLGDE